MFLIVLNFVSILVNYDYIILIGIFKYSLF